MLLDSLLDDLNVEDGFYKGKGKKVSPIAIENATAIINMYIDQCVTALPTLESGVLINIACKRNMAIDVHIRDTGMVDIIKYHTVFFFNSLQPVCTNESLVTSLATISDLIN
jgi:hypothetical protein